MPLSIYTTKDEIPADVADSAVALADGTFGVVTDTDTSSMSTELKEWKRKAEMAERATRKAVEEAEKARTEEKAKEGGITAEKLAEIRAAVRKEVESEYAPTIEQGKAALAENRSLKLDTKVKAIAAAKGVIGSELAAWWKLHGDKFDLTTDGAAIVKDKEGVSLDAFIADECKKETPYLYVGSQAAGGGTGGDTRAPAGNGRVTGDQVLQNPGAALAGAFASGAKA